MRILRWVRGFEAATVKKQKRHQKECAQTHTRSRKRKRPHVVHPDRLGNKTQAPNRGGNQQKDRLKSAPKHIREAVNVKGPTWSIPTDWATKLKPQIVAVISKKIV